MQKIRSVVFSALIFLALAGAVCCTSDKSSEDDGPSDTDDDANNDYDPDHDPRVWTGGGCTYELGKMKSGSGGSNSFDHCIPPLPDDVSRSELEEILAGYLGEYLDENGGEEFLDCRPEGSWIAPAPPQVDVPCDAYWSIPIWATLRDGQKVEGILNTNSALITTEASINFQAGGTWYYGHKPAGDTETQVRFIFEEPAGEPTWNKIE